MSPELFSDPNKTVESDDKTVCNNISDTLIVSDNENDTCTSVSEEVDITDIEQGIFNTYLSNEDVNNTITVAVTPTKAMPMYLKQN
jgi:hypothetical protein